MPATQTFQYTVSQKFFPAHKVLRPYIINVKYDVYAGIAKVKSLELHPDLLSISDTASIIKDINNTIQFEVERKQYEHESIK